MARRRKGNGEMWRIAAVGMGASVLTVGGFFFTIGRNAVTRAEVMDIVRTQAPYVEDRQLLQDAVVKNTESISTISEDIKVIEIEQAKIDTKLDDILRILENGSLVRR